MIVTSVDVGTEVAASNAVPLYFRQLVNVDQLVEVDPIHTKFPVIKDVLNVGPFTVIDFITDPEQDPDVILYNIFTVPAEIGVTTPDELTVAMVVFELDHVPPEVEFAKVIVEPKQTVEDPVMAAKEIVELSD